MSSTQPLLLNKLLTLGLTPPEEWEATCGKVPTCLNASDFMGNCEEKTPSGRTTKWRKCLSKTTHPNSSSRELCEGVLIMKTGEYYGFSFLLEAQNQIYKVAFC